MNLSTRGWLIVWILCFFVVSPWSVLLVGHYWPYETTQVDKFYVDKYVVCRGELVHFWFDGYKYTDVIPDVLVELVDGTTYSVMGYKGTRNMGQLGTKRAIIIPSHVIPGKYKIQWTATFPMNPVNNPVVKKTSDQIEIRDCNSEKGDKGDTGKQGQIGETGKAGKNCTGKDCK